MTETLSVRAGDIDFAALAWGPVDGPLALCLHGYPDTARTWRHLGPFLAQRGHRVVAPYMRGYAPTGVAPDGCYQVGALARDAALLRDALGGERAVLIGHDWGAAAAYLAGADPERRFARVVTLAVPPNATLLAAARDARLVLRQLRMSWYMGFQQIPRLSEESLGRLIPRLWAAWSPGYDAREDVPDVLEALRDPAHATAALRYYRAMLQPWTRSREYAAEEARGFDLPNVPLLYLHGEDDGAIQAELARRTEPLLGVDSSMEVVPGVGHFLHLERPAELNERIAAFIAA